MGNLFIHAPHVTVRMQRCSGSGGGNHLVPGMHRVEYEVSTSITNPHVSITYIDENGKVCNDNTYVSWCCFNHKEHENEYVEKGKELCQAK